MRQLAMIYIYSALMVLLAVLLSAGAEEEPTAVAVARGGRAQSQQEIRVLAAPVPRPTLKPTIAKTPKPTYYPTTEPTNYPSLLPTDAPTNSTAPTPSPNGVSSAAAAAPAPPVAIIVSVWVIFCFCGGVGYFYYRRLQKKIAESEAQAGDYVVTDADTSYEKESGTAVYTEQGDAQFNPLQMAGTSGDTNRNFASIDDDEEFLADEDLL